MDGSLAHDLDSWDAVEIAERIARGSVSRREVLEAAIARAERARHLGAIVTDSFDAARATAPSGPLAGVPTFIKDLSEVRGVRTTWGSAAAGHHVSTRTDPSIERLLDTGLVSLGKSATPEFGLTATTEPLAQGPCRNPWSLDRSVGGSSGGAACLVAAGVVPIAHASDGGGSIRIPAACTGMVGLKPSRRRFDMDSSHLLPVNAAVQGVITRTVRDTIAFYGAFEAQRSRRSRLAPRELPPIGAVRSGPSRTLRVGVYVDAPLGTPVDPEHREAARRAGALCADLGHRVDEIPCPFDAQAIQDFLRFWGLIGFAYLRGGTIFTHPGFDPTRVEPWTQSVSSSFSRDLRGSLAAIRRLRGFTATYARVMRRYDVLVCPTTGEPPPRLGHLATDLPFDTVYERLTRFAAFTPLQNAAGAPAISLPLGRTSDGLPIGVQFAAALGDDRTLLELALALETAAPWPRMAPIESWAR